MSKCEICGDQIVLNRTRKLIFGIRDIISLWSDGPREEWKTDFVRNPVELVDGEWTAGFVAYRIINGEKQFRRATEDEKQDLIAMRMTP
ncbi:hypothetical protein GCM10010924_12130 [Rhizobium wenxiniae]|nr:hypothetical protein GCM10010924_12130 [Rhizobium wenxiniae]